MLGRFHLIYLETSLDTTSLYQSDDKSSFFANCYCTDFDECNANCVDCCSFAFYNKR